MPPLGGEAISNFKSSNTLRNAVLAYPFSRDKRFKKPKLNYNVDIVENSKSTDNLHQVHVS